MVPVGDARTLLVSGGDDGTVRLWDPLAGQELMCLVVASDIKSIVAVQIGTQSGLVIAGSAGLAALTFDELSTL